MKFDWKYASSQYNLI